MSMPMQMPMPGSVPMLMQQNMLGQPTTSVPPQLWIPPMGSISQPPMGPFSQPPMGLMPPPNIPPIPQNLPVSNGPMVPPGFALGSLVGPSVVNMPPNQNGAIKHPDIVNTEEEERQRKLKNLPE